MARAAKIKKPRRGAAPASSARPLPGGLLLFAAAALAGLLVAGALLWASSGKDAAGVFSGVPFTDPGPIHVHGLGINSADGSLFIATHTGLFRVERDARKPVRIGDSYQDTMGFSIVGPNRFLGSGHPDARDRKLPPRLGLIESTDAGRTWAPISLLGEADFHVLRSAGTYVYGYDASNERLLASADGGRTWKELDKPGRIVDLAPHPSNSRRLVTAAIGGLDRGLYASQDGGASWKRLSGMVGLIAWPAAERLYLVDDQGRMHVSNDGGRTLKARGAIGGRPATLLGVGEAELYVALHDGTIKHSTDGGLTWSIRSSPDG